MQAKDRERAQAQQQLREKVSTEWCSVCVVTRGLQEEQLRSSEALVADFQKTLHQRDSELETLRTKVTPPSHQLLTPC